MALPKEIQAALERRRVARAFHEGDPINRVGIELEGAWGTKRLVKWAEWDPLLECWNLPLHEDLSLVREGYSEYIPHLGEMISPPLKPEEAIQWMKERYPDEMGQRCGLHVHTSFTTTDAYVALMSRDFWKYFLDRWEKWYKANKDLAGEEFYSRLSGRNRYCKRFFWPERQLLLKNKAIQADGQIRQMREVFPLDEREAMINDPEPGHFRRTMLNFCWKMHRTIECRLFPMWKDHIVAEMAVRELFSIYRDWLKEDASTGAGKTRALVKRMVIKRGTRKREQEEETYLQALRQAGRLYGPGAGDLPGANPGPDRLRRRPYGIY